MVKRIKRFFSHINRGHLSNSQRNTIVAKWLDLGNLIFIGLVIGQLVPGSRQFQVALAILGVIVLVIANLIAYIIMKRGKK